jgi:hypothetical protein
MTVALFAQMHSVAMLSPFVAAVALRCSLRFCTQCQSLSCQTDGSEKTLISGPWDMAHSLMPHCASWNIHTGAHYWYTQGKSNLSDWLMIKGKNLKALVTGSVCYSWLCWSIACYTSIPNAQASHF